MICLLLIYAKKKSKTYILNYIVLVMKPPLNFEFSHILRYENFASIISQYVLFFAKMTGLRAMEDLENGQVDFEIIGGRNVPPPPPPPGRNRGSQEADRIRLKTNSRIFFSLSRCVLVAPPKMMHPNPKIERTLVKICCKHWFGFRFQPGSHFPERMASLERTKYHTYK